MIPFAGVKSDIFQWDGLAPSEPRLTSGSDGASPLRGLKGSSKVDRDHGPGG